MTEEEAWEWLARWRERREEERERSLRALEFWEAFDAAAEARKRREPLVGESEPDNEDRDNELWFLAR
jgi:hypothetical protein